MNYQFASDNMQISESMKELAQSKLARLEHRLTNFAEGSLAVRVVMNTAPVEQFSVKVEMDLNGKAFFAEETKPALETALIAAVEEVDRQLEKVTSKDWEKYRQAKRFDPAEEIAESELEEELEALEDDLAADDAKE